MNETSEVTKGQITEKREQEFSFFVDDRLLDKLLEPIREISFKIFKVNDNLRKLVRN